MKPPVRALLKLLLERLAPDEADERRRLGREATLGVDLGVQPVGDAASLEPVEPGGRELLGGKLVQPFVADHSRCR